jgi:ABC-type uncharacterized transport system substrate-binding protein
MDDSFIVVHYRTVISSSARNAVPAIFVGVAFVRDGGLISYGLDYTDLSKVV